MFVHRILSLAALALGAVKAQDGSLDIGDAVDGTHSNPSPGNYLVSGKGSDIWVSADEDV